MMAFTDTRSPLESAFDASVSIEEGEDAIEAYA